MSPQTCSPLHIAHSDGGIISLPVVCVRNLGVKIRSLSPCLLYLNPLASPVFFTPEYTSCLSTSCCLHRHFTVQVIPSSPSQIALQPPLWSPCPVHSLHTHKNMRSVGKTHCASNNIYILTWAPLLSCLPFSFHIVYSVSILHSFIPTDLCAVLSAC